MTAVEQALPARIAEELKQLIYSGDLKPGERLNEAALAIRMGTSRGPIREAIRIITGFGLVIPVANKGVYVREISVREMVEISDLRALVFGFAAGLTAEARTTRDCHAFETQIHDMDDAANNADSNRYYQLNLEFHQRIVQLCGSSRTQSLYNEFVRDLHLFRRQNFNNPNNMAKSNFEHRRICEAIVAGNKAEATKFAEEHIHAGCQRMLRMAEIHPAD